MNNISDKKQTIIIIVIVFVAMIFGAFIAPQLVKNNQQSASDKLANIGGDFTLQSKHGSVSLYENLKGQVVALYFGYASCPDICPTNLGQLAIALRQLSEEEQKQIQPIFVSVDPDRDDVEKLELYANAFYPGMLGLTAKKEVIDDVVWRYRSMYKIVPLEGSAMGYSVDHSSIIYVIGRDGVVHSLLQHNPDIAELVEKLKAALAET